MDERLFVLGIGELDEQHVVIINLLKEMSIILKMPDSFEKTAMCQRHLLLLANYTNSHFSFEEKHMEENQFPGLDAHKKLHTDIIDRVRRVNKKLDQPQLALELNLLLTDWLYNHILNIDGAYASFYHRKMFGIT